MIINELDRDQHGSSHAPRKILQNADTITNLELHTPSLLMHGNQILTNLQECAIDLYKRGFNVFPMPYGSKVPYANTSLSRLYNSRLHLCGNYLTPCRHDASAPTFASLFVGRQNIAIMCGKTSGNLLGIDCDTYLAYELIGKELDAHGLPYWTFTSNRGGCYLLRIIEGETANVPKEKSQKEDVELWGNSHYVIVPMSVHPTGTVYRWRGDGDPRFNFATIYQTLPSVSVAALDWLGVSLLKDNKAQVKPIELFGLSTRYAVLSKQNRETLARGVAEGERNKRLTALAYDMAGCNLDQEEIEVDFLSAAQLCRPSYSRHQAMAILKSAYAQKRTPARKCVPPKTNVVAIQQLYSFANSYDWGTQFKRKARTRKLVFMACIKRAEIEGTTFRAAVRELAEITNRKYQFVDVCLLDLINAKLLLCVKRFNRSASGANVYTFGEAVELPPIIDSIITTCNDTVNNWGYEKNTTTDAWKDVFGKLGDVAGQALCYLQAGEYRSKYALAKAMHAPESSVNRAVNRLIMHGLAIHSQSEGLYYAEPVNDSQLSLLSLKLQTNGRAEMQRIKHTIDRELYLNRNLSNAMQDHNRDTD